MMHWQGLTELTYEDYTPLALYNADAAGLQVRADAEWQNAQELLDAVKAEPGRLQGLRHRSGRHLASGAGRHAAGGRHRARRRAVGAEPGCRAGMQDLVAGGVDIVTCSVPEAQALLEAGRVKSLAVMSAERNPAFPDVPTLKEATGLDWTVAAWRGIAGPKGMPQEVADKIVPLLQQIWESQEFRDFMAQRGFGVVWRDPAGFEQWMAESDESLGDVMKAVGLAN